jgi:uncharacterized protein YegP (UPF0339 family)
MSRPLKVPHYIDNAGEHRARICAGNGEKLFVASEGYKREDDLIIARELARRALNDDYYNNSELRARTDVLMARRDGRSSLANALAAAGSLPAPRNRLLDTQYGVLARTLAGNGVR